MPAPISHLEEAQKLTADAEVSLFQITLPQDGVIFRFKNNDTVTWRGNTYEGIACNLSGEGMSADDQESRPTLRVMNPDGIFNAPALDGRLYRAIVTRRKVLRRHLDSNVNIFSQRMWFVERPKEIISGQYVTLELRNMAEGPNFQIPARMYVPPEFPLVSM